MQFRRVQCTKVLFCLTTFVLIVAYVQKLIFYVYHKFEAVQPPWPPSQLPRMVDVNFLQQQNDLIYEPKILCWISTYPRNRLVRRTLHFFPFFPQHQENFCFFLLLEIWGCESNLGKRLWPFSHYEFYQRWRWWKKYVIKSLPDYIQGVPTSFG